MKLEDSYQYLSKDERLSLFLQASSRGDTLEAQAVIEANARRTAPSRFSASQQSKATASASTSRKFLGVRSVSVKSASLVWPKVACGAQSKRRAPVSLVVLGVCFSLVLKIRKQHLGWKEVKPRPI